MIRFFVFTNLWVSICVAALCFSTEIIFQVYDIRISAFAFFSTFLAYNFQSIASLKNGYGEKFLWIKENLFLLCFLVVVSIIASFYFFLKFHINTQIMIIILSLISLFYSFGLRSTPYIKIFLISISWSITSVFFYISELDSLNLDVKTSMLFSSRVLFRISLTIPFDIRDIEKDKKNLRTIPQLFGVNKSKIIAIIALIISCTLLLFQPLINSFSSQFLFSSILIFLITSFFIYYSDSKKPCFYFSFWGEGISIVLFITLLLSNGV